MTHDTFVLRDHKMQRHYHFITKFDPKHGLLATKLSLGDLVPNKPQHKYRDLPSSHSKGMEILVRRPPCSSCMATTSTVHCAAACFASSTICSVTTPELLA